MRAVEGHAHRRGKQKKPPARMGLAACVVEDPARRPGGDRLSRALRRSTMGAGAFHGRVRDGIGCGVPAMATGPPGRILRRVSGIGCAVPRMRAYARLGAACGVPSGTSRRRLDPSSVGQLGPLGCVGRPTSTCGLSTCWSGTALMGRPRLEGGFPLRCLQRLSRPRLATRRCGWRHNRCTRGASVPVLSYWGRRLASLLHPRQIGTELSHDVLNPAHVPL